jgi:hypothetical protein
MAIANQSNTSTFEAENECPHILEINPKVIPCEDPKCRKKGVKKITFDVRFSITPEEKSIDVPLTFKDEKLSFRARPALCGGTLQLKLKKLEWYDFDPNIKVTVEERECPENKKKYTVTLKSPFGTITREYESDGNTQDKVNTPVIYPAGTRTEPCWSFHAGRNGMFNGPSGPLSLLTQRIGKAGPCMFSYEFNTMNTGDWVVEPDFKELPFRNPIKLLMARCRIRHECEKAVSSYYNKHSVPSKGVWKCPIGQKKSIMKQ